MLRQFAYLTLFVTTFAIAGCETDVMETTTPTGTEVEVERDLMTGELETEIED